MKTVNRTWPIFAITGITLLMFFKFFTKGLYPIPADLLVSFYFPWYSGGWDGYSPWTTHKEFLNSDSIRQIYPWKEFAVEEIKKGHLPLWNPYTFSGQPLAANFQSSVYYPLNIFYFFLNPKDAWLLLIIFQPLLAGIFMYLAARSFNISKIGSLFTSIALMFSSYQITWMENGNISNSYLWLPLNIWAINLYFSSKKARYLLILILSSALSILGGHPQTAVYVYLFSAIYWLFKLKIESKRFINLVTLLSVVMLSITLAAIQVIPTLEFYKQSPISLPFSKEVFDKSIMPYQNLVTFFASDFFGNPANNNFWSKTYGDFTPYLGVLPLIFAIFAIIKLWKSRFVKFAALFTTLFIIAAIPGPITFIIKTLRIPVLDSTTPSRFIAISIFLMTILAGLGLDDFLKNIKKIDYLNHFKKFMVYILLIYFALWLFALFGIHFLSPRQTLAINLAVTRRNLVLPTFMALSLFLLDIFLIKVKSVTPRISKIVSTFVIAITLLGGLYFSNKFLPFAPKKFIFPEHPLFYYLKNNIGIDRFYGGGTARIDFNFPTHYKVFGIEGYDSLRIARYAQLLAASFEGSIPETYRRSDAQVPDKENGYRKRLFELMGVKYLLGKEDAPKTGADWRYADFPIDHVKGHWQYDKFQIYTREPVLPRVFLTSSYYIAKSDQDIIQKIYDEKFPLSTLILEKEPSLKLDNQPRPIEIPKLVKYDPNEVSLATNSNFDSLLFLSDAYDPGWQAFLDGHKTEILRAHYAFRAMSVPSGSHLLILRYQPKSFTIGVFSSLITVLLLAISSVYFYSKKRL